ncbi:hypothetical protein LOZ57_001335 [Ophidiomyces ophidiicola]|uniref:uncharacterized protein n=1 Tax=Ophidiomyces ophidiicola TaxID=1387563 RepID=UPI0020C26AE3|nr:uncharacterized protein LOZ57_001335 [Ophidiomyces ophidiicola]KAI1951922.1 hypothetical protein LOZ57_001335 [Ophidiomyces ophidiicola]KAI2045337.1 hypothetical protein LOZ43_006116 [Ophidiomyces ophidiicola]
MSAARLRAQCMPNDDDDNDGGAAASYVRVFVDGVLAGHVFACRWTYRSQDDDDADNDSSSPGRTVCWITQLVVHREYRRRGLATGLLNELRETNSSGGGEVCGILSSHPAACLTVAKVFRRSCIRLDFIQAHAAAIMKASPVSYVRDARLHGSLFDSATNPHGAVSSADTNFHVDHREPSAALAEIRATMDHYWPLGDLGGDGHEYLLIV